jgi:hypothetical protein
LPQREHRDHVAQGLAMNWVLPAILLLVSTSSRAVIAAEAPRHPRWFFSLGPTAVFLSKSAHSDLARRAAPVSYGRGGTAQLAYELTSHAAVRVNVHSAQHSITSPGTGGTASAAFDAVGFQRLGPIAPFMFARIGKQALSLSDTRTAATGALRDYTWNGHLLGGGAGVRWYLTRHISLASEASFCYLRYNKVMSTDGTGTQLPLDPVSGTAASGSLIVSLHW